MAASPVLVDSSWYIGMARRGLHPLRELKPVALVRDLATCGIVRAEVGRGLRESATLRKFKAAWEVMRYVPTDNQLWEDVEQMAWQLDRQGRVLPLSDIVIACCARRIHAVVLTFDQHFQAIPGIVAVDRIV